MGADASGGHNNLRVRLKVGYMPSRSSRSLDSYMGFHLGFCSFGAFRSPANKVCCPELTASGKLGPYGLFLHQLLGPKITHGGWRLRKLPHQAPELPH